MYFNYVYFCEKLIAASVGKRQNKLKSPRESNRRAAYNLRSGIFYGKTQQHHSTRVGGWDNEAKRNSAPISLLLNGINGAYSG